MSISIARARHVDELTSLKRHAETITKPTGQRFIVVIIDPVIISPPDVSFDSNVSNELAAQAFEQLASSIRAGQS